jgi:hypothetical protein
LFGQEIYRPFLEEGKVWTYHYFNDFTGKEFYESLKVAGDTVIEDKNYKKIVDVATGYFKCAVREEGKKVFFKYSNKEHLVYDFGLNVGDTFKLYDADETVDPSSRATVVSVDTIVVGNRSFRVMDVRPNDQSSWSNWWVEGIGGMHGIASNSLLPGNDYTFSYCQIDGETILTHKDVRTVGNDIGKIKQTDGYQYRPMVEDGKVWLHISDRKWISDISYRYLDGDTVIDGHKAKRLFFIERNGVKGSYDGALFEEGKRVFRINPNTEKPVCLYDFSLSEPGDEMYYYEGGVKAVLSSVDTVTVNGSKFRRLNMKLALHEKQDLGDFAWVEGVGGYSYQQVSGSLLGCLLKGRELFSGSDFDLPKSGSVDHKYFAEEGKSWIYHYENPYESESAYDFRYFVKGDTIIDGLCYKKLYCENYQGSHTTEYMTAIFEADGVVFLHDFFDFRNRKGEKGNYAIYDFRLDKNRWWIRISDNIYISTDEQVSVGGVQRRKMGFRNNYEPEETVSGYWVEGIGSSGDLLMPTSFPRFQYCHFVKCEKDGKTLFSYEDFGIPEKTFVPDKDRLPYKPMLEEGKRWNYKYHQFVDHESERQPAEEFIHYVSYVLRGDTLIGGMNAMKIYQEWNGASLSYIGAFIEQDQKIYFIKAEDTFPQLYFDFTLHRDMDGPGAASTPIYLHHVDTLEVNERKYNQYTFYSEDGTLQYQWIEGVGMKTGGIRIPYVTRKPSCLCDYEEFIACFDADGNLLYENANTLSYEQIYFEIEKIDPSAGVPTLPKAPPYAPTVLVNGNKMVFKSEHPAYVLNLVDNEGNSLYTTEIPESVMEIVLPFNLTEDIEVNLLQGDWRIHGRIDPSHETVKVSDASRHNNNEETKKNIVYDLQGRRIQGTPARKGVYIRGGKMIVIK